jgi:hypothetical protein
MVHDALQTLSRGPRGKPTLLAALVCCVGLLSGCGGSGTSKTRTTSSVPAGVGSSIRLDSCTDWRRATIAQRHDTVLELREFSGGPIGSSAGIQHGPVLSDDRAYKLFQSYCASRFARGFKLYKLYVHAAALVGH